MVDINEATMRYAESEPYEFTRIRLHDRHQQIRGRFRITEQPDPMIAVMIGDFIHNLRSALDWVIVACVPKNRRGKANFPILVDDIFAKDKNGDFVVNDADLRKRTETALEGLHPKARALIISLQPYQATNLGLDANDHILGIVSRLENADKHRQLIPLGCGGQDFFLYFASPGLPQPIRFNQPLGIGTQFLKDNTVIPYNFPPDIKHTNGSFIHPSEMDVHLKGTTKIFVKVARIGGNQLPDNMLLDSLMDMAIADVREILKRLEFFARSD